MQKFGRDRVSLFLKGFWLIIAGVLLLGNTAAQAEPYLRVCEKGVVIYYFSSRKQTGLQPPDMAIRGPKADRRQKLRSRLIQAVARMESKLPSPAAAPSGAPDLTPLRLVKAAGVRKVNPGEPSGNMWTGTRYLGRLWGKLPDHQPLAVGSTEADSKGGRRHPVSPPLRETRALVKEACNNFFRQAQEQPPGWGQGPQGSGRLFAANQNGYSFPVAPPFSFRDTWSEPRSGGRYHHAVDIFAAEGTPVYAFTAGVIHTLTTWRGAGITLLMQGQDGRGYGYMHLLGYARGIVEGKAVKSGELIAFVGRTGVWSAPAHLHFQVYADQRFCRQELLNPYGLLVRLCNGRGVTDLFHHRVARLQTPQMKRNNYQTEVVSGVVIQRGRRSHPPARH